ncbi:hypothetical protein [Delftia sp.]|uniref:hypothetical protein n=1 Tax=Delftia sp. TaxID=1886637 RepID=UPI00259CBF40|nr:hypothetical protein [Delftia sp.]
MSNPVHSILLTPELACALIAEMQAVLDGEASYFHAEVWTDSGQRVALHLSGQADPPDVGGPLHV